MRATHFLSDPQTLWTNMLWCELAKGAMTLHAMLFKNVTWHSDRSERELSRPVHLLGRLCRPDINPAWANLRDLLGILEDPEANLSLLVWRFWPPAEWHQARRRIVRKAIMVMSGQLARKLIMPWLHYPWRLWPLALPDVSQEARRACAQQLLQAKPCCLDSGFSQRIKRLHPSEDELLRHDVQDFVAKVFERVVPTSTFIERRFAAFTHWCDKKPKWSTLAAKHVTNFCRGAAQAWRSKHPGHKKESHKARPAWAKAKTNRTTGYNLFVSEYRRQYTAQQVAGQEGRTNFVQSATQAWKTLSSGEKYTYSQKARALNKLRSKSSDLAEDEEPVAHETGGLWDMANLHENWAISASTLHNFLGEGNLALGKAADAWEKAGKNIMNSIFFPSVIVYL